MGAIDPLGYRASYTNAEPWDWKASSNNMPGSNYLPTTTPKAYYKLVAPGSLIPVEYTEDGLGKNGTGPKHVMNGRFNGTSASAPYVSGVAAIILSKNPWLTSTQLANLLISNTDKLAGYGNNVASVANFNNQVFYGSINCNKALNSITGIEDFTSVQNKSLSIGYSNDGLIHVNAIENSDFKHAEVAVYGIDGRELYVDNTLNSLDGLDLNISGLASGSYIISIVDESKGKYYAKFIKD